MIRKQNKSKSQLQTTTSIYIAPKLVLTTLKHTKAAAIEFNEIFPERSIRKSRKIGFKFAGCCPVILKPKRKTNADILMEQQLEQMRNNFNKKTVICRRKLMKPIMNTRKKNVLYDFGRLNL